MRDVDNIRSLILVKPDFIGFIFYPDSSRYVCEYNHEVLFPEDILKIGVFVNATDLYIFDMIEKYDLQGIQLHGDESISFVKSIRHKYPEILIFKAMRIAVKDDLMQVNLYNDLCDALVLDAKGKDYGGNGHSWDYDLISSVEIGLPFLLSGGIGPEFLENNSSSELNIINKLKSIHAQCIGVDINSKFEISPGMKNVSQIKNFADEFNK